jgi:hypothetical protein
MAKRKLNEDDKGEPRRVDVQLLIRHPTMNPAEITAALGIEPLISLGVGQPRRGFNGKLLGGTYRFTAWRHSIRYELSAQWFADKITMLVDRLLPHEAFFLNLRATGGKAEISVTFFSDGHLGDNVPIETLAKMADLQLDFGIECFVVPQSDSLHRSVELD